MKYFIPALLLSLLVSAAAWSKVDSVGVQLTVADRSERRVVLRFGHAAGATFCIDPQFGEAEYPPKPPRGLFDVRFTDHRDVGTSCLGEGVVVDIHPPLQCGIADTFQVDMQAAPASYPLTLSWPAGLAKIYDTLWLIDPYTGKMVNVNMLKSTSASVPKANIGQLYIIAKRCVNAKAKRKKHAKVAVTGQLLKGADRGDNQTGGTNRAG